MVIVIDPQIAGISGDMVLSSLVDLGANKDKIISGIKRCEKHLPHSKILNLDFKKTKKHGIQATQLILDIEEDTHERMGSEIKKAISSSVEDLSLSSKGKFFANSCIDTLILAESKIHGEPVESVHFHEASSIDTLVDIVGTAIALDDLGFFDEEIICMPVSVGGGAVSFSHGEVSNPANAILEIFKKTGISIHGTDALEELTTPTGASILVNLIKSSANYYPSMQIESIGYGAGTKEFFKFSNTLKIVKGSADQVLLDSVKILETNVDDVSGEFLGNLVEKLIENGAKDVSIYSGITKKGRPTNLISVICDSETMPLLMDLLFLETGTLGVRMSTNDRVTLPRKIHEVIIKIKEKEFQVKYKVAEFKGKSSFKVEFDDIKKVSNSLNLSLNETERLIRKEIENLND